MVVAAEFEPDAASWAAQVSAEIDDTVEITLSALATEIRRAIRNRATSRWPGAARADLPRSGRSRATGESLRAWRVRRRRRDIRVFNDTPQGAILSDSPTIRGQTNVHYQAAQRAVIDHWPQILTAAAARAAKAAERRSLRAARRTVRGRIGLVLRGHAGGR